MIYVIKHRNGSVIGFSDNLEYIYRYLKDYFNRDTPVLYNKSTGESKITITQMSDKKEVEKYYIEYYEYQLDNFHGVILTFWEISDCYKLFEKYRLDLLEYLKIKVKIKMNYPRENVTDEDIRKYLRINLGRKYNTLINYDRFMMEMGIDKIREIINGYGVSQEAYDLNKEYKFKINDDK